MKKKWKQKQKQKQKKYRVIPSFQTIAAPPPVESLSFWTDIYKRDMTVDSSLHFSKSQLKRARSAKMAACDRGCDVNLASAFS